MLFLDARILLGQKRTGIERRLEGTTALDPGQPSLHARLVVPEEFVAQILHADHRREHAEIGKADFRTEKIIVRREGWLHSRDRLSDAVLRTLQLVGAEAFGLVHFAKKLVA